MKEYRKLLVFVRPYYGMLILSGLLMGVVTFLDVFRLGAIVPVIDRVFTNKQIVFSAGKFPGFIENILNKLNALSPLQVLYIILIIMPIALVVRALFEFLQIYIMSDIGQKVIRDTRDRIYEKLQTLSLDYFTQKRSGELVSRITNDVKLIENAVSYALTDIVYQSFQVVVFTVTAFLINWKLAIMTVVVLPAVGILITIVGKTLRKLSRRSQESMADINSLLVETFMGVRIVRAFCAEAREVARFKSENNHYYRLAMKQVKRMQLLGIVTELLGVGMAILVIFYSGKQVITGELSFGGFALFMAALLSLIRPFKKLSQVSSIIHQAMAANTRIHEVLESPPTITDKPQAKKLELFSKAIGFENVSFGYGESYVLKDINLNVPKGSMLAIVGRSGVGKSTMVDLIPRFYDPQGGRITVDAEDIRDVTVASLRAQIGIVTQETILFNDTVRNNIAYGKPGATDEEIRDAAAQAHADEFICAMPKGYDTVIGDRGTKLSGGERQRLAIARALLKDPPILILDEATSQLDTQSEHIVQEALERLVRGRTVFVIAHRLSTVRNATKIVVLDNGGIAQQGSHQELIAKDGLYSRLCSMQEIQ